MQKGNDENRIGLIRAGKKIVSLPLEKKEQLKSLSSIIELLPFDQPAAARAVISLLEQDNPQLARYSLEEFAKVAGCIVDYLQKNSDSMTDFNRLFSAIFQLGQIAGNSSGKDCASENMKRGRLEGKTTRATQRQVYYDEINAGLDKGEVLDGVLLEVFETHRGEGVFKTVSALKSSYYRQKQDGKVSS